MKWMNQMLEFLLDERAQGEVDFTVAWRHAAARCRAIGVKRPRDWTNRQSDDPGWLPYSTFVRRALEREWLGAVRADYLHLRELLEDTETDTPSSARHARTRLIA